MAGYDGYSQSWNAIEAKERNHWPLTEAIERVSAAAGVTKAKARRALKANGPSEWHHTSKFYNRTDFYSVEAAIRRISLEPIAAKFAAVRGEERMEAALSGEGDVEGRRARRDAVAAEIGAEIGTDAATVVDVYYEDYDN